MFQFRGFPPYSYVFTIRWYGIAVPGFPIRKSADQWIFAPTRSLSQLVTSFFGSWCQVILPTLFIAWSNDRFSNYLRIRDFFFNWSFYPFLGKTFPHYFWKFSFSRVCYIFTDVPHILLYHRLHCLVFKVHTYPFPKLYHSVCVIRKTN